MSPSRDESHLYEQFQLWLHPACERMADPHLV